MIYLAQNEDPNTAKHSARCSVKQQKVTSYTKSVR